MNNGAEIMENLLFMQFSEFAKFSLMKKSLKYVFRRTTSQQGLMWSLSLHRSKENPSCILLVERRKRLPGHSLLQECGYPLLVFQSPAQPPLTSLFQSLCISEYLPWAVTWSGHSGLTRDTAPLPATLWALMGQRLAACSSLCPAGWKQGPMCGKTAKEGEWRKSSKLSLSTCNFILRPGQQALSTRWDWAHSNFIHQ